jgi:hypothetical protein
MTSKTVWIVGGLVVAIGVVGYMTYNSSPASGDAAGTIVEAKRAQTDGTNSPDSSATANTTDQTATGSPAGGSGSDAPAASDAGAAANGGDGRHPVDNRHVNDAATAADAATAMGARSDSAHSAMSGRADAARAADAATAMGARSDSAHAAMSGRADAGRADAGRADAAANKD